MGHIDEALCAARTWMRRRARAPRRPRRPPRPGASDRMSTATPRPRGTAASEPAAARPPGARLSPRTSRRGAAGSTRRQSNGSSCRTAGPMLVEQFRSLAATLHRAQGERHLKSVVVTSPAPGDGKSHVAVNLALTLSDSYRRRVLLVDADLRRPTLHLLFRVPSTEGLSDALKDGRRTSTAAEVQVSDTLTLLPAGGARGQPARRPVVGPHEAHRRGRRLPIRLGDRRLAAGRRAGRRAPRLGDGRCRDPRRQGRRDAVPGPGGGRRHAGSRAHSRNRPQCGRPGRDPGRGLLQPLLRQRSGKR